tara:strand:- start:273 stop:611 length:339 start_codon:yes stop_codon:yes gene_type:complete
MGNCQGGAGDHGSKEDIQQHREIEKQLRQEKKQFDSEIKILLLGTGDSGKTTFSRQMQILYASGFSAQDREAHKTVVNGNIVNSLMSLITEAQEQQLEFERKVCFCECVLIP